MNTDWTKPDYPGDAVRIALLIRGRELGDVRIQDYGPGMARDQRYCAGAFLPGETECTPGDTPKTWPDRSEWCTTVSVANAAFDEYVQAAYADGWKDYNRETGKAA